MGWGIGEEADVIITVLSDHCSPVAEEKQKARETGKGMPTLQHLLLPILGNAPNISVVIKARYLEVILIPTHASSQSQMPQSDLLIPYLKYILYFSYHFLCISCSPLIKIFIISDLDHCGSLSLVPHSHSCPSPQQSSPHTTA